MVSKGSFVVTTLYTIVQHAKGRNDEHNQANRRSCYKDSVLPAKAENYDAHYCSQSVKKHIDNIQLASVFNLKPKICYIRKYIII